MQARGPIDQALNRIVRLLPRLHQPLEASATLLSLALLGTILGGSAIALAPLWLPGAGGPTAADARVHNRPYSPLELAGFAVYVREGCHVCHSQQIRDKARTVARFGPPSLAAESRYDYPMQWGSRRIGTDLSRIGGVYPNEWHLQHLTAPREVSPETVMPPYGFLARRYVDGEDVRQRMRALRRVGVPYTEAMVAAAGADLLAQRQLGGDVAGLLRRYPGAVVDGFTGADRPTDMDALIAYLQVLGTFRDPETGPDESRS